MSTLAANTKQTQSLSARQLIAGHPLVAYFVIAFAGTWLFVLPFALSKGANGLGLLPLSFSETMLYALGTLGVFAGPPLARRCWIMSFAAILHPARSIPRRC